MNQETPPFPAEAPPDKLRNGNYVPPNPWIGRFLNVSGPFDGETNGKPWTRWDIDTPEMKLGCFDPELAKEAGNAIQKNLEVRAVWRLRRSKRYGTESCELISIYIKE